MTYPYVASDFRLDTPSALLELLAKIQPDPEPSAILYSFLPAQSTLEAAERLALGLPRTLIAMAPYAWPMGEERQLFWLTALEQISLAADTVTRLDSRFVWRENLSQQFRDYLSRQETTLQTVPRLWRFAKYVPGHSEAGALAFPWYLVHSATSEQTPDSFSVDEIKTLVSEWLLGQLSSQDDAALRRWVVEPSVWRSVYVSQINDRLREIEVLAVDEPHTVLQVPLRHLGPDIWAKVHFLDNELVACWPGQPEQRYPTSCGQILWPNDGVLGALVTKVTLAESFLIGSLYAALQDCRKALSIEKITARALALSALEVFTRDDVLDSFQQAQHLFDSGEETNLAELTNVVQLSVEIRATVEELAGRTLDPELIDALAVIDQLFTPFRRAIYLVPTNVLDSSLGERWVPFDGWWGRPSSAMTSRLHVALQTQGRRFRNAFWGTAVVLADGEVS